MQIKIYYGNKPLYLCDELTAELKELLHHPDVVFIDELSSRAIKSILHEIKKENFHAGIVYHENLESLKKIFFKHFAIIEAAGGVVQNENKELLFIFRRGKWDLPKGKMEKKETQESCAEREIQEETGIQQLELKNKTTTSYHIYDEFGKHILKISHWFYFTSNHNQQFLPQTGEDITEARWIKKKDLKKVLENTYYTIRDVIDEFSEYQNK